LSNQDKLDRVLGEIFRVEEALEQLQDVRDLENLCMDLGNHLYALKCERDEILDKLDEEYDRDEAELTEAYWRSVL